MDTRAWIGADLAVPITRRWTGGVGVQSRFVADVSRLHGSYLSAATEFALTPRLLLEGGYRLALLAEGHRHRVSAGLEQRWRLGRSRLALRPLVQYQQTMAAGDEDDGNGALMGRLRAKLTHRVTRAVDVYVASEPFARLERTGRTLDNWRNTLGVQYEVSDGRQVELSYIFRPDFEKRYRRTYHILGVNWDIELRRKPGAKRPTP